MVEAWCKDADEAKGDDEGGVEKEESSTSREFLEVPR